MIHSNEVMNIKELSLYLGCGQSSIRRMIRNNVLEYYRIGNRYLFRKDHIDDWIRNIYTDYDKENEK